MAEVDKKQLFSIIKRLKAKRKPVKVKEPQLTIEGIESPLYPDSIQKIDYKGTKSIKVRKAERNICQE